MPEEIDELIKYFLKLLLELKEKGFIYDPTNDSSPSETGIDEILIHIHPNILVDTILSDKIVDSFKDYKGKRFVRLPLIIEKTKTIINIKNNDNKCFFWSLVAHYFHVNKIKFSKQNEIKNYNCNEFSNLFLHNNSTDFYIKNGKFKHLDFKIKKYPVKISDIPKIEEDNNIKIRVYSLHQNENMINLSKTYDSQKEGDTINLLLFSEHYMYIKNLNKLLRFFSSDSCRKQICQFCGSEIFTTKKALINHETRCKNAKRRQKYSIPLPNSATTLAPQFFFNEHEKLLPVPFRIYADFESYFDSNIDFETLNTSNMMFKKEHKMMAWAFKTVSEYEDFPLQIQTFKDLLPYETLEENFIKSLSAELRLIDEYLNRELPIFPLTIEEQVSFLSNSKCFFCQGSYSLLDIKVRDHDHINGKYRCASHKSCNLKYSKKCAFVPIYFHNLGGYDLHLILKILGKYGKNFTLIPKSKEKYLALSVTLNGVNVKLRFIDTLHFLPGSLANWAKKLDESDFQFISNENKILRSKQIFPYSYFTASPSNSILSILNEENLPTDELAWNNELNPIKEKDIKWALDIYKQFNCKSLDDYVKLYLRIDVLLLAEVFEKFIKVSSQRYRLNPCWFYTMPGYSWACSFLMTGQNLDLLHTPELIEFFLDNSIRGGKFNFKI